MPLRQLLERSRASEPFRAAVAEFLRTGRASERITFDPYSPPVKVERTLAKALEEYPELPLESIDVRGASGCEFFRGTAVLRAGGEERVVRFHWDCKWRAEQEGWKDWFGLPDQARAAREFGYDCFRIWEEQPAGRAAPV
jgi:hypothetical protein